MGNTVSVLRRSNPINVREGQIFRYRFHSMASDHGRAFRPAPRLPSDAPWERMIANERFLRPGVESINVFVVETGSSTNDDELIGSPVYELRWRDEPAFTIIDEYTDLRGLSRRPEATGVKLAGFLLENVTRNGQRGRYIGTSTLDLLRDRKHRLCSALQGSEAEDAFRAYSKQAAKARKGTDPHQNRVYEWKHVQGPVERPIPRETRHLRDLIQFADEMAYSPVLDGGEGRRVRLALQDAVQAVDDATFFDRL